MGQRLPDVVELVTRKVREMVTLVKHPGAVFKREALKRGRSLYENATIPGSASKSASSEESSSEDFFPDPAVTQPAHPREENVRTSAPSPASTQSRQIESEGQDLATQPLWEDGSLEDGRFGEFFAHGVSDLEPFNESDPNYWLKKAVPLLTPGEELKGGQWYRYTIGPVIRKYDWVRWYEAINHANESVIIQEYVLPQTEFNIQEIETRQKAFTRMASLNAIALNGPGEGRDFRILRLIEAFAPAISPSSEDAGRCYLVAKPLPEQSLRDYLAHHGHLEAAQIREVLRQVLQTLQFLHTACRIRFSATQSDRGIPHGNLNLDSLFIRQTKLAGVNIDRQFFIHVADLSLWEHVIYPPSSSKFRETIAQSSTDLGLMGDDLKSLGRIGFQLAGGTVDPESHEVIGINDRPLWERLKDQHLYPYLCRLIGEGKPFKGVDHALQTLRNLPSARAPVTSATMALLGEEDLVEEPIKQPIDRQSVNPRLARWGLPLLILTLLGLGAIAFPFCSHQSAKIPVAEDPTELSPEERAKLYLADAPGPSKAIRYRAEDDGVWFTVLQRDLESDRSSLSAAEHPDKITPIPLMDEIAHRHSGLQWDQTSASVFEVRDQLIQFVERSPHHVGLMRLSETTLLPDSLASETIAHDGLAILVPSTDVHNTGGNLPQALDGKITLEKLKEWYTQPSLNDITFNGKSVNLYFPKEERRGGQEALKIFEEKVLGGEKIAQFRELQRQARLRDTATVQRNSGLQDNFYELMLFSYENNRDNGEISIGFDRLSNAFGQCSVYPLAIKDGNKKHQPLVQVTEAPITPEIDLCDTKGSYFVELSKDYPLRYELALVHRKDSENGATVAQILLNQEAQYLMGEVGLVPFKPINDIRTFVWSQQKSGT